MRIALAVVVAAFPLFAGCSSGNGAAAADPPDAGAPAIVGSGLPCDVDALLIRRCQGCHGASPTHGTPMALVTWNDLVAPAPSDPSKRVVDVAIARMQSKDAPMPPPIATPATADEVATLSAWAQAGAPRDTCDVAANGGDPYASAPTCTTNKHWTSGNLGSSAMHPGGACITCHAQGEGPTLTFGGTVFPSAHEPTDCVGWNGTAGAKVVVTGADGQTVSVGVNASGNFLYDASSLKFPIRAKVVAKDGRERVMAEPQPSGDCNACHTQNGDKNAPGRIVAP